MHNFLHVDVYYFGLDTEVLETKIYLEYNKNPTWSSDTVPII